ncbi:MAG TPA: glutamine-hydrolyzing GMP synthase [Phycisphaerae bacterium]|nr:glutamine-hydrolyzing GMP synthase [Phycisphaerae bacterium]HRY71042.1 glutamine-hydrolyzing GMP synthase [Phycisphaerae bacterium]HSA29346.1 glutamine-hydrolyzing GMP synthase [Phycisphaerae bacterium]
MKETVAILDFGSQYAQLIARRVRENRVFSTLVSPAITPAELRAMNAVGLIFSGGPASVYQKGAPQCDAALLEMGLPVLAICYGMQASCRLLGARVDAAPAREYGRVRLDVVDPNSLMANIPARTNVWMSHGDMVQTLPKDFVPLAKTPSCPIAAVRHRARPIFGVQFHPEVTHTPCGGQILRNFLYEICGCKGLWEVGNFLTEAISAIRQRVSPSDRVICGLSGGVDSSVTAAMLNEAIGDRLVCIFVDNGVLRKNEVALVESTFRDHFRIDLRVVHAAENFLAQLAGVTEPQEKRRRIGHEFIRVFSAQAKAIPNARFLAQGTLYPDVIESGQGYSGHAANIKLHHNVGGLPKDLGFELIEPLRELFKDEVRRAGEHLGLPDEIVWRHPFPGPGLAVRIMGEVTAQRVALLQEVDDIVIEEIRAADWYRKIGQAFATLVPVSTVGVMGDGRSYEGQHLVALRFVETTDFMTADWVRIDHEVLARISSRIMNEVPGVNRVVYDVSSKPPATIEWE